MPTMKRPAVEGELERAKRRRAEATYYKFLQQDIRMWNRHLDNRPYPMPPQPPRALPKVNYDGRRVAVDELVVWSDDQQPAPPSPPPPSPPPPPPPHPAPAPDDDEWSSYDGSGDAGEDEGNGDMQHDACSECAGAVPAAAARHDVLRCPCGCGGVSARVLRAVTRKPEFIGQCSSWMLATRTAPPALTQPGLESDGLTSWKLAGHTPGRRDCHIPGRQLIKE